MFQIGDNVVYPLHGAGSIQAIEEKEVLGETKLYYIITMAINNMQIMIPEDKIESSGIRPVSDISTLKDIVSIYQNGETDPNLSRDQCYKLNAEKIKSGNLLDTAEVMRDLNRMHKEKALNVNEKKLLDSASKLLTSEISLIKGITEKQIKVFS